MELARKSRDLICRPWYGPWPVRDLKCRVFPLWILLLCATVSDVSRALNKHALARVCLITNKHCARNKSKISAYFVWQVSQSTFSIVRAVLYSRTTFRSNSTTSSDQIKLSNLFFFDLDDHSTEFGIFA